MTLLALSLSSMTLAEEPWGKDCDLVAPISHRPQVKKRRPKDPLTLFGRAMVRFHQKVLHPIQGERSNFRPTSSHYTLQAIQAHGFFKGFIMGCDRLMRENEDPWIYEMRIEGKRKWKWDPPQGADFSDYARPELKHRAQVDENAVN